MTVAGEIKLVRIYMECLPCQQSGYPLDDRLGINGRYSHQAERLICLAAASWSYDISSDRLQEFCGLSVSDTTIRSVSQRHGALANTWLRTSSEVADEFREAEGEIEFTTDGTSVNTRQGWREMKVGLFSRREAGEGAEPDQWASRKLPTPHVRIAFAAIEKSDRFGRRWKAWCRRLGITDTSEVTLLADGAKWIWEEQRRHLIYAEGVLDIFHVLEHLSDTGKSLYADEESRLRWLGETREILLSAGFVGLDGYLQQAWLSLNETGQAVVKKLQGYLAPHIDHLNYAERLKQGRSIGSGQVEGACKNLIGRRLKANSAQWNVRRVNRMAGLCSVMYSQQWELYWQTL